MSRCFCYAGVCLLVSVNLVTAQVSPEAPTVGGRILWDYAVYDSDDAEFNDGGEFRKLRLFAKGKLSGDWFYKFQYDFTGSGNEGIRDSYLGYSGVPHLACVRIGNFIEYGSLEDTTSSKYLMFMERSLPVTCFVPAARRMGIGADAHGSGWYAGAGIFGEGPEHDNSEEEAGSGASARFVLIPMDKERNTVHLGIFGQYRTPPSGDTVRYRVRPEAHVDNTRLIDTGVISNVNHTVMYGAEAAWILGSASLQGEYIGSVVDRDGLSSENYGGYYITASWFFTGESVAYDSDWACLARVKPERPVDEGGMGALAIACRYSSMDLNDSISGGEEDNVTVGLNWHPTGKTRFMLNYVNAQAEVAGVDTEVDIVQLRAQVDF